MQSRLPSLVLKINSHADEARRSRRSALFHFRQARRASALADQRVSEGAEESFVAPIRDSAAKHVLAAIGIHEHRVYHLRREARSAQLALGFLRGRAYRSMETLTYSYPDWGLYDAETREWRPGRIEELMEHFVPPELLSAMRQRFVEWRDAAHDDLRKQFQLRDAEAKAQAKAPKIKPRRILDHIVREQSKVFGIPVTVLLADAGITKEQWGEIVRGALIPSHDQLRKLSSSLGISPETLTGIENAYSAQRGAAAPSAAQTVAAQ